MQVKFLKLGALKLQDISFKFFDFFCFCVWFNFNSFSFNVPINAACCSHRSEIASKKGIFHSWEQSSSKWRDFTS